MTGIRGLFTEGENYSSDRLNAKTVFAGTGSEIAALSMALEIPLAMCTLTESGFIADVLYARSADGLSWLPTFRKHYHDSDTDAAGGLLFDIERRNIPLLFNLTKHLTPHLAAFVQVNSGGGTTVEVNASSAYGLEIRTSLNSPSVINDAGNIMDGGPTLNFANRHILQWKGRVMTTNTSILFRLGCGMEYAHSAPDNAIKFGVEGCDGDGVNIQLVSADTVGRTKVNTGVVMNPATPKTYRIDYNPALSTKYDDQDGASVTKTSNTPSTGLVTTDAMFRAGIKTPTTTQQKYLIKQVHLMAKGTDSWF